VAFFMSRDQMGLPQDFELVGNQRLARPHRENDFGDVSLIIRDGVKNLESGAIGGDVQEIFHLIERILIGHFGHNMNFLSYSTPSII